MLPELRVEEMLRLCDERMERLAHDGVAEGEALDRTFDAFAAAVMGDASRCRDERDRMFTKRLMEVAERGRHEEGTVERGGSER